MLFAGAASLHGCSDPDGIIEDIAYGREFSPLNFTHTLANNVNVTFSWTVMTGIADYTLTLSYADGEGGVYDQVDLIAPLDGDGNTVKTMEYSFRELPGNREWIAELVAVSQRAGVADSKPATCAFATGVENLFPQRRQDGRRRRDGHDGHAALGRRFERHAPRRHARRGADRAVVRGDRRRRIRADRSCDRHFLHRRAAARRGRARYDFVRRFGQDRRGGDRQGRNDDHPCMGRRPAGYEPRTEGRRR